MDEKAKHEKQLEDEIEDLRNQLEDFQQEKERVRAIVGKCGGVPTFNTRTFNIIFFILVIASLAVSLIARGTLRLAMSELAIAAISFKLIFLMHNQSRVNHFQLWIMTSIEWRLNEMMTEIRNIKTPTPTEAGN
ncbi:hypothetical protein DRQ36_08755 [bacterium]|nr:MAG: hypothetical protein DRQ36_08755 [bacterium]